MKKLITVIIVALTMAIISASCVDQVRGVDSNGNTCGCLQTDGTWAPCIDNVTETVVTVSTCN